MNVNLTLLQNHKRLQSEFSRVDFSAFRTRVALGRIGMVLTPNTINSIKNRFHTLTFFLVCQILCQDPFIFMISLMVA